jgi:hypothetical protein
LIQILDLHLRQITDVSTNAASFWNAAHGWAPREAADSLSQARLDWRASLSRTLSLRVREVSNHPGEPGVIIIAWAHLRALVEGHLKLFLAVFLNDYLSDPDAVFRKGQLVRPDDLQYQQIRQFLLKRKLLSQHHCFIATVQQRGNAIHAFTSRDIGTGEEYLEHIALYRDFLFDLDESLPKP